MALSISKWLETKEISQLQKQSTTKLLTQSFFRDPFRRLYYNPDVFLSPADGVVLYAYPKIGPTEKIVEIKGEKFTVQDLLYDKNYQKESLVIGIFMTILDVHINRMPTNGLVRETTETPFILTHNSSMYFFEQDLLNKLKINKDNMKYLFQNEKLVSEIYCQEIRGEYYIIQIADKDVNAIIQWGEGDLLQQGERFGMIRWGSQVDLVIPLMEKSPKYEILVKPGLHIEGGIDKIVRIIK